MIFINIFDVIMTVLVTSIIFFLIMNYIKEERKGMAALIMFIALMVLLGIGASRYIGTTEVGIPKAFLGTIPYVIALILTLFLIAKVIGTEKKIGKFLFFFSVSVLLIVLSPVAFYMNVYRDPEMAVRISNILSILAIVMIILGLFTMKSGEGTPSGKGSREGERGGERKMGRRKKEIKNPFEKVIKEARKRGILLLLLLIPSVYSVGYIILYYPEPPTEILIPNYNNYSVEKHDTYAKITVQMPPGKDYVELTLICLFEKGHYKKSVVLMENETKVLRITGVSEEPTMGLRNLFSAMGLYNFWLPMFIVFLLVYAILGKVLVVKEGEEIREVVGKDVRILIAFSISLIFGASSWATKFVTSYLPYIGAGLIAILGIGMLLSFALPGGLSEAVSNETIRNFLIFISFYIFIISILIGIGGVFGMSVSEVLSIPVYEELTLGDVMVLIAIFGVPLSIALPKISSYFFGR